MTYIRKTHRYGLLVPSATPRNIVTRLGDEVKRILAFPEFQSSLAAVGMTPVASSYSTSPSEYTSLEGIS